MMPEPWIVDVRDDGRYFVRSAGDPAVLLDGLTQDAAVGVAKRLTEEIARARSLERDAIIKALESEIKGVGRSLPEKWVRVVEAVAAIRERA
jgi:hypothetical protein